MSKVRIDSTHDFHVEHHPSVASAINQIKTYLTKILRRKDHNVAVFDIDETMLIYIGEEESDFARTFPRMKPLLNWLRDQKVDIAYITARREWGRKETRETMKKLGLWKEGDILMMKPNDFPRNASALAKAKQRAHLENRMGYTIVLNMGDQMSDMLPKSEWKAFAKKILKLPDSAPLKQALTKALHKHNDISAIMGDMTGRVKHCLLFIQLEPRVLLSVKMPNIKFFTK